MFTDATIRTLNARREGLVFMLWGKQAQDKKKLIDTSKHCILETVHPSGLSAHRGFFGCKHFSKANAHIEKKGGVPIDWRLEE